MHTTKLSELFADFFIKILIFTQKNALSSDFFKTKLQKICKKSQTRQLFFNQKCYILKKQI